MHFSMRQEGNKCIHKKKTRFWGLNVHLNKKLILCTLITENSPMPLT